MTEILSLLLCVQPALDATLTRQLETALSARYVEGGLRMFTVLHDKSWLLAATIRDPDRHSQTASPVVFSPSSHLSRGNSYQARIKPIGLRATDVDPGEIRMQRIQQVIPFKWHNDRWHA